MEKNARIYIAGHTGLVGSSIKRLLEKKGYGNLIFRTRAQLDLERQLDVEDFFNQEKPEFVFLAAARVGGILANNTYPAEFIYNNLLIQVNVINAAYKNGVKKLLFLGSSCIYPKLATQPMKEEYLLTSELEPTNEAYAVAKIAGLKMCRYYNEQYGTNYISVMPTNLYGPNDNYDLNNAHVLPALIRKFSLGCDLENNDWRRIRSDLKHFPIPGIDPGSDEESVLQALAAQGIKKEMKGDVSIQLWGSGTPKREFLHVDDLAGAVVFLMDSYDYSRIGEIVNIGTGEDISIMNLANMVKEVSGFRGQLNWDTSKPDGTPRKLLDVSRMGDLGWRADMAIEDGVRMTYLEYRKRIGDKSDSG